MPCLVPLQAHRHRQLSHRWVCASGLTDTPILVPLQAHIGIVSSATAILKDMEERGLLRVCGMPAVLRMTETVLAVL